MNTLTVSHRNILEHQMTLLFMFIPTFSVCMCTICLRCECVCVHPPVVVCFEGSSLGEAQVFGLLISQLCEVGVKRWQVESGHKLV